MSLDRTNDASGLNVNTFERELEMKFSRFGALQRVQMKVTGKRKSTFRSASVYFEDWRDAKAALELSGTEIDGRKIRVGYSSPTTAAPDYPPGFATDYNRVTILTSKYP